MMFSPFARLVWFAAILVAAFFLFVAASSAERSNGVAPACTHGLSSIGPVSLENGKIVGGNATPTTETCLP